MKTLRIFILILATLLPLRAEDTVSFDYFYDSLLPYGEWCEVDGYGYVWHPTGVDEEWEPYTDGYWAYTDAGWTWVSYEDWGAITYHYGRWTKIDDYGWCWVPDYEWGPAWVAWRKSEDYIGWAPLPPEATWERDTGISTWVDVSYDIGPTYYNFCRWRDFGAPVVRSVILPRWNSLTIIGYTTNITNITYNTDYGCVYNGGFDYGYVAPLVYRPLPTLILVQNTTNVFINGNNNNVYINSRRGNTLVVTTPRKAASNPTVFTRKPVNTRKFDSAKVNRGWKGIKDPAVRDRLLVKVREENKGSGPKTAPAKPFKAEQVAVVPKTADPDAKIEDAPSSRPQKGNKGNRKQDVAAQPPGDAPEQSVPRNKEGKDRNADKDKPGQVAPTVPTSNQVAETNPAPQPTQPEAMPGEDETENPNKQRPNKQGKSRNNLVAPRDNQNEKESRPQRGTANNPPQNGTPNPVEQRPPVNAQPQVNPVDTAQQQQRQAEAEQKRMQKQQETAEAAQRRNEQKAAQENVQRQEKDAQRSAENAQRAQEMQQRQQQQQENARQQQESVRKQQQEAAREQNRQQQEVAKQQQETVRKQQQDSVRKQQQESAKEQQRAQQQNVAREQQRMQQEAAREQATRQQTERGAAQAEARQRQQMEAQQQRAAQQAEARERAQGAAQNARRGQEMQQRQAAQSAQVESQRATQAEAQRATQERQSQQQQAPSGKQKRSGKNRNEED